MGIYWQWVEVTHILLLCTFNFTCFFPSMSADLGWCLTFWRSMTHGRKEEVVSSTMRPWGCFVPPASSFPSFSPTKCLCKRLYGVLKFLMKASFKGYTQNKSSLLNWQHHTPCRKQNIVLSVKLKDSGFNKPRPWIRRTVFVMWHEWNTVSPRDSVRVIAGVRWRT